TEIDEKPRNFERSRLAAGSDNTITTRGNEVLQSAVDNVGVNRHVADIPNEDTNMAHKEAERESGSSEEWRLAFIITIGTGCAIVALLAVMLIAYCIYKGNGCCAHTNDEGIFYDASQFQHMGPLEIDNREKLELEVNREAPNEVGPRPHDIHFTFTTSENKVFDIGPGVENVVD
uniref:Uncharacterized protein n=1 Tax=Parascaris univalens TaxID=6257 RepID=A0A915A130_PARUN